MKHCFRMAAIIILILSMNTTNSQSEEIDKKSELYSDLYTRILNNMLLYHSEQKAIKFKESLNSGAISDDIFVKQNTDNFEINRNYDLYIRNIPFLIWIQFLTFLNIHLVGVISWKLK